MPASSVKETAAFLDDYRAAHDGNEPPDEVLSNMATRQAGEYLKRRPENADAKGVAELAKRLESQVEARMDDKDKKDFPTSLNPARETARISPPGR